MNSHNLLILAILLLLSGMVEAKLEIESCRCECRGKEYRANASNLQECQKVCGAAYGALTKLYDECEGKCANDYCDPAEIDIVDHGDKDDTIAGCNEACVARCNINSAIAPQGQIVPLVRYAILGLIVVMLAYCGLKYLLAEDPESRVEARRCIIYVLAALILVVIADYIVESIYKGGELEPPLGPGVEPKPGAGEIVMGNFKYIPNAPG